MRKIIIISILVLGFNFSSFSQESDTYIEVEIENYIGIQASLNYTSLFLIFESSDYAYVPLNPYLTNISGGISYKNFSEKLVGLTVDLNYLFKGGYGEFTYNVDTAETYPVDYKYLPAYIELKPLMNIRFGKKRSRINIYAGLHVSRLVGDKLVLLSDSYGETFKTTADNKFEFGLDAGAGYSFNLNKSMLELRFLYSHGLTDVFNNETTTKYLWFNQNQVFSGSLYYYLKLKEKK